MSSSSSLPAHLISLQSPDGASIAVSLHGGHLCSWRSADGVERLFVSERSHWDNVNPIRGGVPVVFPQFADQGPLQKHGFARTLPWTLLESTADTGTLRLGLDSSAATAALDGQFSLELLIRFTGQQLAITLAVTNTGSHAFDFMAALHTYLRTPIDATTIVGLQDHDYIDSANGRRPMTDTDALLAITQEVDRIYAAVDTPVEVRNADTRLTITQQGFADVVTWNPWHDKAATLPDMAAQEYLQFVCIEAALIQHPQSLAPGQTWHGQQQLHAIPLSTPLSHLDGVTA